MKGNHDTIQKLVDLIRAETGDTFRFLMLEEGTDAQIPCVMERHAISKVSLSASPRSSSLESHIISPFILFQHPQKGTCMKASHDIPRGTLILQERPLYVLPEILERHLDIHAIIVEELLSPVARQIFFQLDKSSGKPGSDILQAIYDTNSHSVAVEECISSAVFSQSARISHSCSPNAVHHFNASTFNFTLQALRDIKSSEEISISYYPLDILLLPKTERIRAIRSHRGFQCLCQVCVQKGNVISESDERRTNILMQTNQLLKRGVQRNSLESIKHLLHLHDEEDLATGKTTLYGLAVSTCRQAGLEEEARFWAKKELDEVRLRYGANSQQEKNINGTLPI